MNHGCSDVAEPEVPRYAVRLTCGHARRVASDAEILGDLEWQIQGNWSPRDASKPIFGPDGSLRSIFWVKFIICDKDMKTVIGSMYGYR